jgi:hypothetical protein
MLCATLKVLSVPLSSDRRKQKHLPGVLHRNSTRHFEWCGLLLDGNMLHLFALPLIIQGLAFNF